MFRANLTYFQDNPWQPRQAMRQDRLEELAGKIYSLKATRPATRGLLQLPAARLVDANNQPVQQAIVWHLLPSSGDLTKFLKEQKFHLQLAWGHRRKAAFELLTKGVFIPPLEEDTSKLLIEQVIADDDYQFLPFELVEFTDLEMFELAVTENGDRDDLTPIETAQAMATYRDQFGKSSAEIGKLFGMSGSAVRNMIRLLELPVGPRQALAEGKMSQGTGRALLSLYAIPEATRKAFGTFYYNDRYGRDEQDIVEAAMNGEQAAVIEAMITKLVATVSRRLENVRWSLDELFAEEAGIEHPDCATCLFHVVRQKEHYCAKSACFTAKVRAWERQQIQAASLATGLPIDMETLNKADFNYGERKAALNQAQAAQCPNLRLRFSDHMYQRKNDGYEHCTVSGYPGAEFVCVKLEQHCTCIQAVKAGMALAAKETLGKIDADPARRVAAKLSEEAISQDDLDALNREIREQKRQAKFEVAAIREDAAKSLFNALSLHHLPAWKDLLSHLYGFSAGTELTIEDLFYNVATYLVSRKFRYETNAETDVALNLRALNRWFKDDLHLDPLQPVSIETPPTNTPDQIEVSRDGEVLATYENLAEVDPALLVPGTTLKAVYESNTLLEALDPNQAILNGLRKQLEMLSDMDGGMDWAAAAQALQANIDAFEVDLSARLNADGDEADHVDHDLDELREIEWSLWALQAAVQDKPLPVL